MFLIGLYFGGCLLFLLPLMIGYVRTRRQAQGLRGEGSTLRWFAQSAALLLLPLIPYGILEARTVLTGRSIMPAVRAALAELYLPNDIVTLKVLSMDDHTAEIYVVTPTPPTQGQTGFDGDILTLYRTHGAWVYTGQCRTVWSDSGSADGNIFPPYPAKGDYPRAGCAEYRRAAAHWLKESLIR